MASPEPEKGEEVGASHVDPGGGFERKRRFSDEKQEGNPTSKKRLDEIHPDTRQAATSGQSIPNSKVGDKTQEKVSGSLIIEFKGKSVEEKIV